MMSCHNCGGSLFVFINFFKIFIGILKGFKAINALNAINAAAVRVVKVATAIAKPKLFFLFKSLDFLKIPS